MLPHERGLWGGEAMTLIWPHHKHDKHDKHF